MQHPPLVTGRPAHGKYQSLTPLGCCEVTGTMMLDSRLSFRSTITSRVRCGFLSYTFGPTLTPRRHHQTCPSLKIGTRRPALMAFFSPFQASKCAGVGPPVTVAAFLRALGGLPVQDQGSREFPASALACRWFCRSGCLIDWSERSRGLPPSSAALVP